MKGKGSRLQARQLSMEGDDDADLTAAQPPPAAVDDPLQPHHQHTSLSPPLTPLPSAADDGSTPLPPPSTAPPPPPPSPPPPAPSPPPRSPALPGSASSAVVVSEVFEIEDFSTATAWERFVGQVELRCVEWGIDRGRLGRGRQQRCELLHSERSYTLAYHSAAPAQQTPQAALFLPCKGEGEEVDGAAEDAGDGRGGGAGEGAGDGVAALLSAWLGVRSYVLLSPSFVTRKVSRHEATTLLSALSLAATAAQCALPLLVTVGERWKMEYWGITTAQSAEHPRHLLSAALRAAYILLTPSVALLRCPLYCLRRWCALGCAVRAASASTSARPPSFLPTSATSMVSSTSSTSRESHSRTTTPHSTHQQRPSALHSHSAAPAHHSNVHPSSAVVPFCSAFGWSECRRVG